MAISGAFTGARCSAVLTWQAFDISYDIFMRTTNPEHGRIVREVPEQVYALDDIYFAEYEGRDCAGCERFLTDQELAHGRCPGHGTVPEPRREGNWFFAYDA